VYTTRYVQYIGNGLAQSWNSQPAAERIDAIGVYEFKGGGEDNWVKDFPVTLLVSEHGETTAILRAQVEAQKWIDAQEVPRREPR
jgi:hypothetical protein